MKSMWASVNRFHMVVLVTWQFSVFFATQQLFGIFANYVPQFQCGDEKPTSSCADFNACEGNITFVDVVFHSAALEFSYICGPTAYLASFYSTIQYFGVLCGTLLFGSLSDAFGRKPIAIFVLSLGVASTFLTGLSPTFHVLLVMRFFVGLSAGGVIVVVCTLVMELILADQRMVLRGFFNWGWGRVMLTLICMAFPDWRMASYASAIATLPALFAVVFILPESPTWLHSKGRLTEMRAAERYIAKMGGVSYEPVEHHKIDHTKTICDVLSSGDLRRRVLVLCLMWFVASLSSYANDLNANNIAGNFFVNQILFGTLVGISKAVLAVTDTYVPGFTRRILHQGAQSVVCVCFFILLVMSLFGYRGVALLLVNVLGTVFIEYTWDACYLCATESVETSCRASATGLCSLVARIGAMISPILNYAAMWWPPSVFVAVVGLGLVNVAVSYAFLVETKDVNLDAVHMDDVSEETSLEALDDEKLQAPNDV